MLVTAGLVKEFDAGGRRPTVYQLLGGLLGGRPGRRRRRALDDITFGVGPGQLVAVVGDNGAGKTTLLKIIGGVYRPTRGRFHVDGSVALLAGLGAGMIDDLRVRDNVYLYGAICGLPRRTLRERFDDIVRWAEVESFVDAELRTLSRGLRTRLAFAVTRHVRHDLILLDEGFGAGDRRFQERAEAFLQEVKASGRTVLVATHNLDFVKAGCDRVLWLHQGRQMAFGPVGAVLPRYLERVAT